MRATGRRMRHRPRPAVRAAGPLVHAALALTVLACGCDVGAPDGGGGGGGDQPDLPAECPAGAFLTVAPVPPDSVRAIVPLGNLNPPGHTFPTDHMYFYLDVAPGDTATVTTALYAPGDLRVTWITAFEHVDAGILDYRITLAPCAALTLELAHVTALDARLFGDVSGLDGWTLESEYSTGGETYRMYRKLFDADVVAGTVLGTAGGNPGQWALDVGAYDTRQTSGVSANPDRWRQSRYANAVCPLDLYEEGAVKAQLLALVERDATPGDAHPCGEVLQDVPGTAHGCWFVPGTTSPYPEDPHLALVAHNTHPALLAFSVGTSVATLASGVYTFAPAASGYLNRAFDAVTADGHLYGYQVSGGGGGGGGGGATGITVIAMPDARTLRIEHLASSDLDPASWAFTGNATVFER